MSNAILSDICEDFSKAQRSRRQDYSIVRRGNRRVMSIHLGGIYIECLLKSIIIRKYGIIKRSSDKISTGKFKCCCWYDQTACNKVNSVTNISESVLFTNRVAYNPEHNIVAAFRQISELNNGAPAAVVKALAYLNKPSNKWYIDYRYMSDDEINDEDYNKWEESFLTFRDYFNKRKSSFTFRI